MSTVDLSALKPYCDCLYTFSQALQMSQDHTWEYVAHDAQQRDTPVVVAVAAITLVFIQGDDLGVTYAQGYLAFSPAET